MQGWNKLAQGGGPHDQELKLMITSKTLVVFTQRTGPPPPHAKRFHSHRCSAWWCGPKIPPLLALCKPAVCTSTT